MLTYCLSTVNLVRFSFGYIHIEGKLFFYIVAYVSLVVTSILCANLHIHQLQNTHEYMNTHMHITHITNIFRIDEMKEINPYIGEQIYILSQL